MKRYFWWMTMIGVLLFLGGWVLSFSCIYQEYYPGAVPAAWKLLLSDKMEVEIQASDKPSVCVTMDFEKVAQYLTETGWKQVQVNEGNTVYQKESQFVQYFALKQTGPFFFYCKGSLTLPVSLSQAEIDTILIGFMGSSSTVFLHDHADERMQRLIQFYHNIVPVLSDHPLDMGTAISVQYHQAGQLVNLLIDAQGIFILSDTPEGNWIPLISVGSDEMYEEIKRFL